MSAVLTGFIYGEGGQLRLKLKFTPLPHPTSPVITVGQVDGNLQQLEKICGRRPGGSGSVGGYLIIVLKVKCVTILSALVYSGDPRKRFYSMILEISSKFFF